MTTNIFAAFETPVDTLIPTNETISQNLVPHKIPTVHNLPYRIAIIGDSPSADEHLQATPFVGMAGKLLTGLLSKAQIVREGCLLCSLQTGDARLGEVIKEFSPNIILLLGREPFLAATGKTKGLDDYRGSLFICDVVGPFLGRKCISSYHPTSVLRQYDWIAYLWFDILKALRHATTPDFIPPQRNLIIAPTADEIVNQLLSFRSKPLLLSSDIEGYWNNFKCCSMSNDPSHSIIVPFQNMDGTSYWQNEDDEIKVWKAFADILADSTIPKLWQNGLYDRFCLQYGHSILVLGNTDDTMLQWWEKFCELEKGLGVQASILSDEPYYKSEIKSSDRETYYRYCCKDSAVTLENHLSLKSKLDPYPYRHYTLNIALQNAILYMELRGIKYDKKEARKRLAEINTHIYRYQAELDALANVGIGFEVPDGSAVTTTSKKAKATFNPFSAFIIQPIPQVGGKTTENNLEKDGILTRVQSAICYKKSPNIPKKDYEEAYPKILDILSSPFPLTPEQIGFINISCGWSMNIKSKTFKDYLYGKLQLPSQYKTDEFGKKTLTTDYISLLKIQKKQPHHAVQIALDIGELRTRAQMLEIAADLDGRVRCGYNIVGTETGRLTCYTSPTGSGYNLQTIPADNNLKPKEHPLRTGFRDIFIADEGSLLYQCDLAGADGWTIGCHLAALGDPTMLDDLRFGIKPAARICYMLRHGNTSLHSKTREEIKSLLKEVKKEDYDYFACKQGIWGTCYLMGPMKLSDVILIQSEGSVAMSKSEVTSFQNAVFQCYDIRRWHRWMTTTLAKRPELRSPSGHIRRFWGRHSDILGQALANEPQEVTTYSTKLALYNLWTDPDNRIGNRLICEPLHTVHDSLLLMSKAENKDWVEKKLKRWFDNEITIAGIKIKIPYSFEVGTNWGFTDK